MKVKKLTLWKTLSLILALLLVWSIYTGGFNRGSGTNNAVPAEIREEEGNNDELGNNQPSQPTTIDTDEAFLGSEDAKVTVIEYSDFECPFCAAAAGTHAELMARFTSQDPTWTPAVPGLKKLAEEGKIKFIFKDYPLGFHTQAQKASEAAECAGEQEKYWEMHDALFEQGVSGGVASFKGYAKELGLDTGKFDECLDSGAQAAEVKADMVEGQAAGVSGTPAFLINGQLISGAQPFSALETVINAELAK